MDALNALLWMQRLASVAVILTTTEYLGGLHLLDDGQLLGFRVASLRSRLFCTGLSGAAARWLFARPRLRILLGARLACATVLLFGPAQISRFYGFLAIGVAVVSLLMFARSPYGQDGADQLIVIVFIAIGVAHLSSSAVVRFVALAFVALQAALAYATAGFAKLFSSTWRNTDVLTGVLSTKLYGRPRIAKLLRAHPHVSTFSRWAVILLECALPVAVLAPAWIALPLLGAGVILHLSVGVIMRLHTFFWCFISTYPAILFFRASLFADFMAGRAGLFFDGIR